MKKLWTDRGWDDYLYWQTQDKKTLRKVNQLIADIERSEYTGIGKPEPLRDDLSGWWSRQIDEKNRIVYRLKNGNVEIAQCKGHYDDK
ncbi:MAG: Txe/YoeB family addiction module toxin [Oscillospiraceae bacterium]|jgi:toxin YoeB|nr:Txe/YoeB family addiction module toxin [Oscillospiraceae bacterium]